MQEREAGQGHLRQDRRRPEKDVYEEGIEKTTISLRNKLGILTLFVVCLIISADARI
jgi:hypothetical protein